MLLYWIIVLSYIILYYIILLFIYSSIFYIYFYIYIYILLYCYLFIVLYSIYIYIYFYIYVYILLYPFYIYSSIYIYFYIHPGALGGLLPDCRIGGHNKITITFIQFAALGTSAQISIVVYTDLKSDTSSTRSLETYENPKLIAVSKTTTATMATM